MKTTSLTTFFPVKASPKSDAPFTVVKTPTATVATAIPNITGVATPHAITVAPMPIAENPVKAFPKPLSNADTEIFPVSSTLLTELFKQ